MLEGQETSGSKADGRFVPIFVSSTMSIDWEQAQGDKRPLTLSLPIGAYRRYHGDSGRPSPKHSLLLLRPAANWIDKAGHQTNSPLMSASLRTILSRTRTGDCVDLCWASRKAYRTTWSKLLLPFSFALLFQEALRWAGRPRAFTSYSNCHEGCDKKFQAQFHLSMANTLPLPFE